MSADAELLRRAAALMRERAEALKGDRWVAHGGWVTVESNRCTCGGGGEWPHEKHCGLDPVADVGPRPAEHIASWHPAVALAAADWLADEGSGVAVNPRAVALARAYLGKT